VLISEHGFAEEDLPTLPIATGISADAKTVIGSPLSENQGGWIIYLDKPLVTFGLDGDFNNDDTVDAADYVVWRNGIVSDYTQADYNTWRVNFGATTAVAAAADDIVQVPEPGSIALCWCAVFVVSVWRQFRRSTQNAFRQTTTAKRFHTAASARAERSGNAGQQVNITPSGMCNTLGLDACSADDV
jgi:hypothetical protein